MRIFKKDKKTVKISPSYFLYIFVDNENSKNIIKLRGPEIFR